jgi:L-cysteine desulfidase
MEVHMSRSPVSFSIKDILSLEVAPALGCTEPVAIALGAAAAAALLGCAAPDAIEVWVDPNIYKNGIAVSIPGTGGLSGLDKAAALGAVGGDPRMGLEVLEPIDEKAVQAALKLINAGKVTVNLLEDKSGIYVRTIIKSGRHSAETIIEGLHDNITYQALDGKVKRAASDKGKGAGQASKPDIHALEAWLKALSLDKLVAMLDDLDEEDLAFLQEGVQFNTQLADYGLKFGCGLGVGKTLERLVRQRLIKRDMIVDARILTSSAADARMAGVKLPAMSSAGSGNHGLTAILPIVAVEKYLEVDRKTFLEAIALSHLITAYVKAHTGRLSAICGCSVAAGAGATSGITYLLGGDANHLAGAIKNLTEDLAGVICDGAKGGCALKLATAAGTAVQAALFSLQGVNVSDTDGIIHGSPEGTMKNIGILTTEGMIETDRTILKIMLEKHF